MNKLYLITYSPGNNFNPTVFHAHIKSMYTEGVITDWWHYIDYAYIIASSQTVNNLYNKIYPGVPKKRLLIIEIDPNNQQGWLPLKAWEWLKKYKK